MLTRAGRQLNCTAAGCACSPKLKTMVAAPPEQLFRGKMWQQHGANHSSRSTIQVSDPYLSHFSNIIAARSDLQSTGAAGFE